jgi:hypothetical protein
MKRQQTLFVLSLILLLPVVLTGCMIAIPEAGQSEGAAPAPEEMQLETGSEAVSDSSYYAENPELLVVDRYTTLVADEARTGSAFYAANPELMVASREVAVVTVEPASSYADIDPLQRLVRCCYGTEKWAGSSAYLAANPELSVVDRYENSGIGENETDDTLDAANPELMIANRYAAAREENLRLHRICFPGR